MVNLIWHFITNAILSLLFSVLLLAIVNAVLFLCVRANLRQIKFALRMRHLLRAAAPDALFECHQRKVSAVRYSHITDEDEYIHIYTANYLSPLAWNNGRLVTTELRRRANLEFWIGATLLLLVVAPLLAATAW